MGIQISDIKIKETFKIADILVFAIQILPTVRIEDKLSTIEMAYANQRCKVCFNKPVFSNRDLQQTGSS